MSVLYFDSELLIPVEDDKLFEGEKYYLNLGASADRHVKKWLEEENILNCIVNYHPKNSVHTLKFDNVVGYVKILGSVYDVRSKKLFDGESGNNQFQKLLDDILEMHSRLTFDFKGVSYAQREPQHEYSFHDLEVFDYYYQLAFILPASINLDSLMNQCLKAPNTVNIDSFTQVELSKAKKIAPLFFRKISSDLKLARISDDHSLVNTFFPTKTFERIGKRLIPIEVTNVRLAQTLNSVENRFLKFFLEEINSLCLRIVNQKFDEEIKRKAIKLQKKVGLYLLNPFFKNLTKLSFVPASSSVLLKGNGYREIYYHFVQSKFSFRPILEEQRRHALRGGLKNIATLYELWVFYKIAVSLFGKSKIAETFTGNIKKGASLVNTYKWENEYYSLFYNKSYTRLNGGSYSVTLRPDVSLNVKHGHLFLFDAKYKYSVSRQEEDELARVVKPEDIHKMHAYLDAIPSASSSIVVYPGTQDVFYNKSEVKDGSLLSGVGAVPLVPGMDNPLDEIILRIKNI